MSTKEALKIVINENFRIEADKYQYILIESYQGNADKNGVSRIQEHNSYYPTLEQCIRAVRNIDIKRSSTIDEIFDALTRSYALDKQDAGLLA